MPSIVSMLLLSFAVSLDSFGVGLNYGLRRIVVPKFSILIIGFCSGVMILLTMLLGALMLPIVPEQFARWAGGIILIAIGIWAFVQMGLRRNVHNRERHGNGESHVNAKEQNKEKSEDPGEGLSGDLSEDLAKGLSEDLSEGLTDASPSPKRVIHLEIRRPGIVIEILRKPVYADVDRSGTITAGEAMLLGAALSLDACGAGIGAAWIGLSPWITAPLIALFCAVFLQVGIHTGILAARAAWVRRLTFLPGLILIMLGLSKLL